MHSLKLRTELIRSCSVLFFSLTEKENGACSRELSVLCIRAASKMLVNFLASCVHKFTVIISNTKLETKKLTKAVPKGSVHGPKLFCIYTRELARILEQHKVKYKL